MLEFKTLSILVILTVFVNIVLANNAVILSSPRITDLGHWGQWEECPDNTFVMGMRLKTEPAQGN